MKIKLFWLCQYKTKINLNDKFNFIIRSYVIRQIIGYIWTQQISFKRNSGLHQYLLSFFFKNIKIIQLIKIVSLKSLYYPKTTYINDFSVPLSGQKVIKGIFNEYLTTINQSIINGIPILSLLCLYLKSYSSLSYFILVTTRRCVQ